jgi:hypothetical protein
MNTIEEGSHEIWVVAPPARVAPVAGEKSLGVVPGERGLGDLLRQPVKLNVEAIGENLRRFVESMNIMMARLPAVGEPFRLEEIELSVELNAEGNFQLIGGAKAGITGGLTLTLKRLTSK